MLRTIWHWIVDADDWIGEAVLDGAVAFVVALIATESLRSLVASL